MPTTRPQLDQRTLAAILNVAMRAGQLLLEWGSDTHRVEETVHRLGTGLGADWMDVYVTPTGIMATATSGEEHRTKVQRLVTLGIDLQRIDAVNQLSRRVTVEHLPLATVISELEEIARAPRRYPPWQTIAAVVMACAAFAVLFGGGWRESLAAALAGFGAMLARLALLGRKVGPLLIVTPVALLATLLSVPLARALGTTNIEMIVPAAVIMLVPGITITNAFSDLLAGDVISGVARTAGAILVAAEIAVGVALGLAAWTR